MPQLRGFLKRFRHGQPVRNVCDIEHHNRVADVLENILGINCRVEKPVDGTPWKIIVDGSSDLSTDADVPWGGSFPWGSNYTFGITQTAPTKIKVWKGAFRRWGDEVFNAADTEVTFAADGDGYIVWRWSIDSGLEIITTAQTNWPPESDSTYIYGVVHQLTKSGDKIKLKQSVQTGIINAPIFTAAGT